MNRLAGETSPYLRQHADNPVDWFPWGEEAFAVAQERDRPILLSVGYSACHWCHVMAHESFEDADTAAVMNQLFVSVKVDREERPDVDAVYMNAVQALTGQGGWPMTVFLTPDRRPFFGGTYFSKDGFGGRPRFVDVLLAVNQAWRDRRGEVLERADALAESLDGGAKLAAGHASGELVLGPDLVDAGCAELAGVFDKEWGGFGHAPKFPQPANLELLLRAHAHDRAGTTGGGAGGAGGDKLAMVRTTLDAMASGGMYDHLGGGFSRYSTDAFWMVPHFEKMLYDQAGLARAYLHAWQVTGSDAYRQVVEEIVGYVLRDLSQPEGGFSSAEDADSEGEEGKFYVWRQAGITAVLSPGLADAAIAWYGVTKAGNFEGANILHRPVRGDLIRPPDVEEARRQLLAARSHRVRPGLDDKVLTEWNAMWVSTLAEAGAALGRTDWLARATACGDFLLHRLRPGGRWHRSWQREGEARHLAYAADYAWLVDAFTRLHESTGQRRWIDWAVDSADRMLELFWDDESGGLFTAGHDAEQLIVRQKELVDTATPSANSVAAAALQRLAALTGRSDLGDRAAAILATLSDLLDRHPMAFTYALAAVDQAVTGITEVVVSGERPDLVAAVHSRYLPDVVLAWGERFSSPLWEGRTEEGDAGRAYVCENYTCQAPVTDTESLLEALG